MTLRNISSVGSADSICPPITREEPLQKSKSLESFIPANYLFSQVQPPLQPPPSRITLPHKLEIINLDEHELNQEKHGLVSPNHSNLSPNSQWQKKSISKKILPLQANQPKVPSQTPPPRAKPNWNIQPAAKSATPPPIYPAPLFSGQFSGHSCYTPKFLTPHSSFKIHYDLATIKSMDDNYIKLSNQTSTLKKENKDLKEENRQLKEKVQLLKQKLRLSTSHTSSRNSKEILSPSAANTSLNYRPNPQHSSATTVNPLRSFKPIVIQKPTVPLTEEEFDPSQFLNDFSCAGNVNE